MVKYKCASDAIPKSWVNAPLPNKPAKRPVGRPRKRTRDENDDIQIAKRVCLDVSDVASVVADMPSVVADMPSVVADMPSVVDDMSSVVADMSSVVADMPSVVDDMSSVVADMSSVVADMPSVVADMPSVVADVLSVVADMPSVVADMPSVVADVLSVVADMPSVVADMPSVVADMPSVVADMPSVVADVPSVVADISSVVDDTDMPKSNGVSTVMPSSLSVTDTTPIRGRYKQYTLREKLVLVEQVKLHGLRQVARVNKIPLSTLGTWCKKDYSGVIDLKRGHSAKSGRPVSYGVDLDEDIQVWVLKQRDLQIPVSVDNLCDYARTLVKGGEFKASRGWATHFMRRHELSIRQGTSIAPVV